GGRQSRRRIVGRDQVQKLAIPPINIPKLRVTYADSLLQHGCKHRLKIAGRAGNDLEHFRVRGLLLQRVGELACTLLLCLEQTCVLDGDNRLICEGLDQFDLLLIERSYGSPVQNEHADWKPIAQKWHAEECAIVTDSRDFTQYIFRIGKNVRNL